MDYQIKQMRVRRASFFVVMKDGHNTSSRLFQSKAEAERAMTEALSKDPNIDPTKI